MTWIAWTLPAVWLLLAVIDRLVKKKSRLRYRLFLERYGLSVSLGRIQFYTSRVNHWLVRLSDLLPRRRLQAWFSVGAVTGLMLVPLSVVLLAFTLHSFIGSPAVDAKDPVLVPVLPGVNLPWSQLFYFVIAIAVSGVLHELGHAVAAVNENVHIDGVGLFFFVMYPGAFVDLHTQHVATLNPMQKLRIFCAGVWHNVMIVLISMFALYCLPWILLPLFTSTEGAVVNGVSEGSPVYGHLVVGSIILSVDGYSVHSKADWTFFLSKNSQHGFCNDKSSLKDISVRAMSLSTSGVVECCPNGSMSDFCFHTDEPIKDSKKRYFCLNARKFTDGLHCMQTSDCLIPGKSVCLHPSLDSESRLFRITHDGLKDVIFVGHPMFLHQTISLTDYRPRIDLFLFYQLPDVIETFLLYLISLSSALGMLNSVPVYYLDGQWILGATVDMFFTNWSQENKTKLTSTILIMGTLLLVSNVVLGLIAVFT